MKGSLPLPLWTIAAPILAWLLFTGRRCCSARQSARPRYRDWRSAVGARGAGLVITRQRPGTATGVVFPTLENETGPINVVVWSGLFERERRIVLGASLMVSRARSNARARSSISSPMRSKTKRPCSADSRRSRGISASLSSCEVGH